MKIDPLLRALSEPTRLRIMRLLAHMELAVGELAQVLGQSQPRVSRHVKILCDAGLAQRRKEGSWVFLRTAVKEKSEPPMGAAAAQLLTIAERDDPAFSARCAEDRRQLAAIREARESSAQAYFALHAEEWDTLRQLHGADGPVETALLAAFGRQKLGALLDVGTGTGRMAELLSGRAGHVTALDKSPDMLRIARARLQSLPPDKLSLVQGDFTALPFAAATFDTVLFHQVLHYAQDPGVVLAEAARVTVEGGRVAVVDLAAHDREELRERHAHARLGFSDEQMEALLAEAGFAPELPTILPGDPLTVKIWTARRLPHAAPDTISEIQDRKTELP
ncbi:metalloregulator ArsR/SmtB family transcription factor [Novosphingobium sp. TCA1]|uniref:ArsR family transcriptional regulator n=1 Tax=Novosphingobium pentaromativorans TaxID=205844 RepID=A0A2W5NI63_9SPHN|nr:metalloregulator ArsR/SmtB family transcription factor [Novosphingobium sp. TCA1]PZQ52744.1 MAG: ArsR family transcriptional regulator [Novosphingobium pentaromativorans]